MKYKVGDILINTEINHPYKVIGFKNGIYKFKIYSYESKTWKPSAFEWWDEELEFWTLISPVIREIYED